MAKKSAITRMRILYAFFMGVVVACIGLFFLNVFSDIDPNLGLRHRSAIGVTEQLDVLAVIVSEETGAISYAIGGEIHHNINPVELRQALEKYEC